MSFPEIYYWVIYVLFLSIAAAGVVGAVLAGMTRDDAFEAAGRQPKMVWVGILGVSALVLFLRVPFVSWIGIVAIGIYWFDVRPQIKDILSGNYHW